jgi:hypothetical protein
MRLLFFLLLSFSYAAQAQGQPSLFDVLHANEASAAFKIETNWSRLVRKKRDKSYQPATVTVSVRDTTLVFAGKLRSRGNVRLEVCHNPSLKLKLEKADLLAAGFSDLNEFKFVLQCTNTLLGESYLNREKVVYDLHAVYSSYSHRTLPASLDLGKEKPTQAFMIEHEEQIAARFNARVLETKKLSTRGLQRDAYVNMCLFNYLILNTDWHVFNLHNLKFINPTESLDLIPVPYDFDYSGFVGAHYAVPHSKLDISSIYEPKWLGKHVTPTEIKTGAKHYLEQRAAAEQLIQQHPDLSTKDRKRLLKRLNVFYKILEDEKRLLRLVEAD